MGPRGRVLEGEIARHNRIERDFAHDVSIICKGVTNEDVVVRRPRLDVVLILQAFLADDEKDSAIIPFFAFGVVSIFFLWALSSFWFYRITLGMLKQIKKGSKKS